MWEFTCPGADEIELVRVLDALNDPVRLAIVRRLDRMGDLPYHLLACASQDIAEHCQILQRSGILLNRIDGSDCRASLRRADLDRRFPGLLTAILSVSPGASPARATLADPLTA